MVASWACEVTEVLTQRSIEKASFMRISVTSQAQIATICTRLCLLYMTLFKVSGPRVQTFCIEKDLYMDAI